MIDKVLKRMNEILTGVCNECFTDLFYLPIEIVVNLIVILTKF